MVLKKLKRNVQKLMSKTGYVADIERWVIEILILNLQ